MSDAAERREFLLDEALYDAFMDLLNGPPPEPPPAMAALLARPARIEHHEF